MFRKQHLSICSTHYRSTVHNLNYNIRTDPDLQITLNIMLRVIWVTWCQNGACTKPTHPLALIKQTKKKRIVWGIKGNVQAQLEPDTTSTAAHSFLRLQVETRVSSLVGASDDPKLREVA